MKTVAGINTLFEINFWPSDMSPEALADGFKDLFVGLCREESSKWRRNNFKKAFRNYLQRKAKPAVKIGLGN